MLAYEVPSHVIKAGHRQCRVAVGSGPLTGQQGQSPLTAERWTRSKTFSEEYFAVLVIAKPNSLSKIHAWVCSAFYATSNRYSWNIFSNYFKCPFTSSFMKWREYPYRACLLWGITRLIHLTQRKALSRHYQYCYSGSRRCYYCSWRSSPRMLSEEGP